MRNARQGAQIPKGDEVPALQQIMETMRVLQQATRNTNESKSGYGKRPESNKSNYGKRL